MLQKQVFVCCLLSVFLGSFSGYKLKCSVALSRTFGLFSSIFLTPKRLFYRDSIVLLCHLLSKPKINKKYLYFFIKGVHLAMKRNFDASLGSLVLRTGQMSMLHNNGNGCCLLCKGFANPKCHSIIQTSICTEEAIFWQIFQPTLHSVV